MTLLASRGDIPWGDKMWVWLVLVFLFLFVVFRPGAANGSARPTVRPTNRTSKPKQRLAINTSCLPDRAFSLHELALRFDVHLVETVKSHDELWVPAGGVSVVHVSTRKGLLSAIKQLDPHVYVDKNDGECAAGLTCRVVLVGDNKKGNSDANGSRVGTSTIGNIHGLLTHLSE